MITRFVNGDNDLFTINQRAVIGVEGDIVYSGIGEARRPVENTAAVFVVNKGSTGRQGRSRQGRDGDIRIARRDAEVQIDIFCSGLWTDWIKNR